MPTHAAKSSRHGARLWNARQLIPRRFQQRRVSEETIAWLGTPVDVTIADTTPVEAVRVSQSLAGTCIDHIFVEEIHWNGEGFEVFMGS